MPAMTHSTAAAAARSFGTSAALDKLVDDLGTRDDAVGVVRTFAATLSWRASRIERAIVEGHPQSSLAVMQDLRNAAIMVGAEALAQWCRLAIAAPHRLVDGSEIVELAAGTHDWLESWLDERNDEAV